MAYDLPLPAPDEQTRPFWDAARGHQLVVQRCLNCGKLRFPPPSNCPRCAEEAADWAPVSGNGTIFSFVIVHHAVIPAFASRVPYNVALVALQEDEDVQLCGDVVDVANESLRIGMPVRVVFDDVAAEDTLPRWETV